jgi:hypothetical protein
MRSLICGGINQPQIRRSRSLSGVSKGLRLLLSLPSRESSQRSGLHAPKRG